MMGGRLGMEGRKACGSRATGGIEGRVRDERRLGIGGWKARDSKGLGIEG